jgi:hypothetical protein
MHAWRARLIRSVRVARVQARLNAVRGKSTVWLRLSVRGDRSFGSFDSSDYSTSGQAQRACAGRPPLQFQASS